MSGIQCVPSFDQQSADSKQEHPALHVLRRAFPRTVTTTPVASPAAQLRPHGRLVATHAGLTQQEYWQALEEFAAKKEKVWHKRLKYKAVIKPLTAAQQYSRYVGSWKYTPLNLDPDLRKPAAILSKISGELTHAEVQALLSRKGFNAPPMLDRACGLNCSSTSSSGTSASQWSSNWYLLSSYSFDHIIPASRGGQDHPDNYFLMPLEVNNYFGNRWTAEKVAYIGLGAAMAAGRLRWHGLKLKPSLLSKLQAEVLDHRDPMPWPTLAVNGWDSILL